MQMQTTPFPAQADDHIAKLAPLLETGYAHLNIVQEDKQDCQQKSKEEQEKENIEEKLVNLDSLGGSKTSSKSDPKPILPINTPTVYEYKPQRPPPSAVL